MPTVSWEKDGAHLEIVGPGMELMVQGSLRLDSVQATDGGHYRCIAINEEGTAERIIILQIESRSRLLSCR